jgi:hypothetical protein
MQCASWRCGRAQDLTVGQGEVLEDLADPAGVVPDGRGKCTPTLRPKPGRIAVLRPVEDRKHFVWRQEPFERMTPGSDRRGPLVFDRRSHSELFEDGLARQARVSACAGT